MNLVQVAFLAEMETLVLRVSGVSLGNQAIKVHWDLLDLLVSLVHLADPVKKVLGVLQVHGVLQA